jgi:predicted transcriptional regulator of viral defense system
MIAFDLNKISKPYFGYEEIARIRGISLDSAKVTASRYVRQGLLLRLKKNLYVRWDVWNSASKADKFRLANLGQSPSYVSLMTALDYYEITTQMQQDFFESVAVRRTKEIQVDNSVFRYSKIDEKLFFEFKKENGFFIASPEKALLDAFYLMSYGRYSLDISAMDADKLDRQTIKQLSSEFPLRTQNMLNKHGYLQAA